MSVGFSRPRVTGPLVGLFAVATTLALALRTSPPVILAFWIGTALSVGYWRIGGRTLNDELLHRVTTVPYDGEVTALEASNQQARKTVDTQIRNLGDIDTRAARILRLNAVLVGLILTALSATARLVSLETASILNVYVGTGVVLLLVSTGVAGVLYTASRLRVGVTPEDLVTTLEEDLDHRELQLVLAKSYAAWIEYNARAELQSTFFLTMSVLLVVASLAYLSLGVYAVLVSPVPTALEMATNLSLLCMVLLTGFPHQLWRLVTQLVE